MSKARHSLPRQPRHTRFAKRDDDVSFQRDVREKRSNNGPVAPCTVENRNRGGREQPSPEDQIAELSKGIEIDRRAPVSDQGRVRQDRHGQHVVSQDQQDPSGPRKTAALPHSPNQSR